MAENKQVITDKIMAQVLEIRSGGSCNMLDTNSVQREANKRGFYELVIFIEEQKKQYCLFILYGER
jgi:hypothetical protein